MVTVCKGYGDWLGASRSEIHSVDQPCCQTTSHRRKGSFAVLILSKFPGKNFPKLVNVNFNNRTNVRSKCYHLESTTTLCCLLKKYDHDDHNRNFVTVTYSLTYLFTGFNSLSLRRLNLIFNTHALDNVKLLSS